MSDNRTIVAQSIALELHDRWPGVSIEYHYDHFSGPKLSIRNKANPYEFALTSRHTTVQVQLHKENILICIDKLFATPSVIAFDYYDPDCLDKILLIIGDRLFTPLVP